MPEKMCPTCHRINKANASFCIFCGSSLAYNAMNPPSTRRIDGTVGAGEAGKEGDLGLFKTPERGIALYILDYAIPPAIIEDKEFILGRKITDIKTEQFFDLTPYGGYENGISNRHALVRQTDTGYEIIDLVSTNGTQVNDVQLIPLKPYHLHNGSQIRLGMLTLYVTFAVPKSKTEIP